MLQLCGGVGIGSREVCRVLSAAGIPHEIILSMGFYYLVLPSDLDAARRALRNDPTIAGKIAKGRLVVCVEAGTPR